MKLNKFIALILLLTFISTACGQSKEKFPSEVYLDEQTGAGEITQQFESCEYVSASDPMQTQILEKCKEIVSLYYELYNHAEKIEPQSRWDNLTLSQDSIDAIENLLINAGYDVMDTNERYPSYLTTADKFYAFWDAVKRQEPAEQEVIFIRNSGDLSYLLFTYDDVGAFFYCMSYCISGQSDPCYEIHQIQDWELTDRGNFFYRIRPADDKHYPDFSLIRTAAPDPALCDFNLRCVLPIGYVGTNIFLRDWNEKNWNELSFNDLWEYLYFARCGTQYLPDYSTYLPERGCYKVPASEFERIIMPYFQIDIEDFRTLAQYNAEGDYYPWRPLETNDVVFLWYYSCLPEVTAYKNNPDGTITLTVEALSDDLKMDCIFAHEVTIRPLENGEFQYVGNKVTYQTEYGLPYCKPRLTWD